MLADYVERLVIRERFILHQNTEIVEKVKELKDWMVNAQIIDYFIAAAQREEFWLDLVCPRLYPILLHNGPYRNVEIDLQGIAMIAGRFGISLTLNRVLRPHILRVQSIGGLHQVAEWAGYHHEKLNGHG